MARATGEVGTEGVPSCFFKFSAQRLGAREAPSPVLFTCLKESPCPALNHSTKGQITEDIPLLLTGAIYGVCRYVLRKVRNVLTLLSLTIDRSATAAV